ncbi:hypothetical protein [Nocardioides speluncae]|uniref:hypothetical protein n=1 Tax=Nocardioides speluncae TaxID=2670337 RepID=UPI000D68E77B|nr:hypothetical protein [Nocardioides speluncae]
MAVTTTAPDPSPTPEPGQSGKPARSLPRALTPFRTAAYRRLALALVLSTFASGVWVVTHTPAPRANVRGADTPQSEGRSRR